MENLIGLKIKKFSINAIDEIKITLNNGATYSANLSKFNDLYCYPKNFNEWKNASIGENGADIEWESGFAVHLDQIAMLALEQKSA